MNHVTSRRGPVQVWVQPTTGAESASTVSTIFQNPIFQGTALGMLEAYSMHWTTIWKICRQLKVGYPNTVKEWFQGVTYAARAMVPFFIAMQVVNQKGTMWLKERNDGHLSAYHRVGISAFSSFAGTLAMNPVDTTLVQLKMRKASSMSFTAKAIYREAGLAGFFRLVPLTVARNFPYALGIQVATPAAVPYVEACLPSRMNNNTKAAIAGFGSAVFAGSVFGIATQHFDVVRTRLFAQPFTAELNMKSVCRMYQTIWAQEGFSGFCKGMVPRIARTGLGSGMMVLSMSMFKYASEQTEQRWQS